MTALWIVVAWVGLNVAFFLRRIYVGKARRRAHIAARLRALRASTHWGDTPDLTSAQLQALYDQPARTRTEER